MFTGLVECLGNVRRVDFDSGGGRTISISGGDGPLNPGESIAVNGCCLTVVASEREIFTVQVGPETLRRTNLGDLAVGHRVNLERALRVGDRLGGHFVTGHIDAVGVIAQRIPSGDWETVWFTYPPEFNELLVVKGSIAVDGVSLTLVEVEDNRFSVMLIPHTSSNTTLGFKAVGSSVNIETDLIAKHVKKLFQNLSITI